MKLNISDETLSTCRTSIKIRLETLNQSIRDAEEKCGKIPSWMIERRNVLMEDLAELEHIIDL